MKGYPGTTPTVEALGKLNFEGNIIPRTWRQWLRRDSGKVNSVAIDILAELVYWYRPILDVDEVTGHVKGWRKKFKADKLQKSYKQLSEALGHTERQVADNARWLKKRGYISIEKRSVGPLDNILFMDINVQKLEEISFPKADTGSRVDQSPQTQIRYNVAPKYVQTDQGNTLQRRTYTENTNKEYTHSKKPDSEQSSGVCETSPKAPLEKKPASKPVTEDEGVSTLIRNEKNFKKLGVQISGALKSAAHGLTRDDVINAGKALQEAIDSETVKNRQGYLMSALRSRYAPSEEWIEKQQQEQKRKEAARLARQEQEQQYQRDVEQIDQVRQQLAKMEASGEITIHHDRSQFVPGGDYWFEYPGLKNISRCDPTSMPPSREWILQLNERIKTQSGKL